MRLLWVDYLQLEHWYFLSVNKIKRPGSEFLYMLFVLSFQVYKQHNIWELLTFKSVNPMMDIGITRQLDFADLLELPSELRADSCYDKLLSSWTAEHQNHHADPSLLRAMFHAYGWIYLRLGMLKVLFKIISEIVKKMLYSVEELE
jgi:ATP-binding cassette subfamily C (CFTR/MRP) protein 10